MSGRPRGLRRGDDPLAPPGHLGRGVTVGGEDERHPRGDELRQERRPRVLLAHRLAQPRARDLHRDARGARGLHGGVFGRLALGGPVVAELLRQVEVRHHVEEPGRSGLGEKAVVLVPEVRGSLALVPLAGPRRVDPPARDEVDRPEDDVPVVRREELAQRLLVPLGVVGLDAEEDVDPPLELLSQGEHLLHVAGQLAPRHREAGVRVLAGEEVERDVVGDRHLRQPPRDGVKDVISGRAAGVPAARGVDVVIRHGHAGGG